MGKKNKKSGHGGFSYGSLGDFDSPTLPTHDVGSGTVRGTVPSYREATSGSPQMSSPPPSLGASPVAASVAPGRQARTSISPAALARSPRISVPGVGSGAVMGTVPSASAAPRSPRRQHAPVTAGRPVVTAGPTMLPMGGPSATRSYMRGVAKNGGTPNFGLGGSVFSSKLAMIPGARGHNFTTNHGHGMSNCNYAERDEE
jgi:hypothetical protein